MTTAAQNLDTIASYVSNAEAREWDAFVALLHPEVVYEIPQSRERVHGREALRAFNTAYPGDWHLELAESYADTEGGVARLDTRIGIGQTDTRDRVPPLRRRRADRAHHRLVARAVRAARRP